ncbi:MAG: hypothetical protein ACI9U2_002291 [Bradymonadia bacterium]
MIDSGRLTRSILFGFVLATCWVSVAEALPLYTARGGRTCDNCHSLPNTWYDPEDIGDRKCTLSCAGCHVDPSGGGLRTASGRYYGEATLPMFAGRNRPLDDRRRDLYKLFSGGSDGDVPSSQAASSQPTSGPVKPATAQGDPRPPNAPPATRGWLAFGEPLDGGGSTMAWLNGRYDDMNADPLLLFGGDFRLGFMTRGPLFFPMQADVYAAVHPVEHLMLSTTVGARGRTDSLLFEESPLDDQPRFAVRDIWLMTHEWPYLSYARIGRFLPAFGTRLADHTAPIRRAFGMSQEDPANRVIGGEVGFTGNYPYAAASVFSPSTRDARNPFEPGDGWGTAINGGYRALGWQVGASAMLRRRSLDTGGDTTDVSLQWGFNPWFYSKSLPFTYLGEVTAGQYQRQLSGKDTQQIAQYHQLAWTMVNGVIGRLRYDSWDPDVEIKDDEQYRPGVGLDLTIIPRLTLSVDGTFSFPAGGEASAGTFIQLHGWL